MFNLGHPSMALNSHDVPPPDYKMYNSYKVPADHTPSHILGWTAKVAGGVNRGLRCLVVNCHGGPGKLYIGTGITSADTTSFKVLNGLVNTIFLVACEVGGVSGQNEKMCSSTGFNGQRFCSEIAKNSGAVVFCSSSLQSTGGYSLIGLTDGCIDEFEGAIYQYNSNGTSKTVSNDYIRRYVRRERLGL